MVGGVLYFTAGSRRDAVAVDAATGETLWMYRLDEGERGDRAVRTQNRGLAYWSDGKDDSRILLISPGFQLVALDARHGPSRFRLRQGRHRRIDRGSRPGCRASPGQIGAPVPRPSSFATWWSWARPCRRAPRPASKTNVPGYIRGFDVRTGQRIWTFNTIPRPGEFGNETWENRLVGIHRQYRRLGAAERR